MIINNFKESLYLPYRVTTVKHIFSNQTFIKRALRAIPLK